MMKALRLALICLTVIPYAAAQQIEFPTTAAEDDAALAAAMPRLAEQVIATYNDSDRDKYLDNLFRLQVVAGQYADANKSLVSLRELRQSANQVPSAAANVRWEIYARARASEVANHFSFDEAFKQSFREVLAGLDDKTAYRVLWSFGTSLSVLENDLRKALDRQKGKTTMVLPDAVDLVRKYLGVQGYRSFQPLIANLADEDDRRRYVIDKDIPVRTPDGATVCTMVVRPRAASGRLPALLNFTIYADPDTQLSEARRTASNGYAGVEGLTRGKGCSPDKPVPMEHDGSDAAVVIDWISRQAWSDGRVGMYGGSYDGFTQWAAAKQMPRALKALMPSVTFAPGIDFPMDGNVFMNYAYPWPFYTTNLKGLDNATYYNGERWNRLNREWYVSGRAYRALDKIDGTPNPLFNRWLDHPTYDAFWQQMIPYEKEFARINIPVLTTTGYYDSGQIGALYYFAQHHQYNPAAEHYLVIGPYDHIRGQRGTVSLLGSTQKFLRGYELDPVAQIDMGELRYQWFNYVFKGGPKPGLLKDKVNYEVMGANVWRHVPSLAAMAGKSLRFHLTAVRAGDPYRLSARKPAGDAFIAQRVDLADRSDVDRGVVDLALDDWNIVEKTLDTRNGVEFVSDPLTERTEVSGLFSGRLDFIANKKDFDFSIALYELTPKGEFVQLSYYWARASHVRDRSHRRLLTPGKRQRLDFKSGRLTSRQLQPGSRLVVVLSVIKQPGEQINYGTGKDVSDESIADAKVPLQIKWSSDSYLDIPVRRADLARAARN